MTFSKNQVYCVLDYETFSETDLTEVGAWEYSVHPSTEILCAAWRIGTMDELRAGKGKTESWVPRRSQDGRWWYPLGLAQAFANPAIVLVAHNALFEQVITRHVLPRYAASYPEMRELPPRRWVCTAALAAALALPRNLEGAAQAMQLPVKKDMEGRRLMLKWCKPRKPTKNNPSTRHFDEKELERLVAYCETDVDTEVALFTRVPALTETERRVWVVDQEINMRGFAVDRPLVETVQRMIAEELAAINERASELTFGAVESMTKRQAIVDWLESEGVFLPDLTAKTVEDALEGGLVTGDARTMLELRRAAGKTSVTKYEAFEARSRHDGRLRDILVYHTASTGRWGGSGIQPQNFARGSLEVGKASKAGPERAAAVLAEGDLELVRLVYGDPLEAFSSCLRAMIVVGDPEAETFDVADYAAIEARVLFWVAGHEKGLQAFREGRDLYKEQASSVFGMSVAAIGDKSFERFIGKGLILGCGYQMGADKFADTCKKQGREVAADLAETAVKSYRATNQPVVRLWAALERAAIAATLQPGTIVPCGKVAWLHDERTGFLWCRLPSGRRLSYPRPRVAHEVPKWGGDPRPKLYHYGVDSVTRKWVESATYGGRLTENVVQAIARDLMAEAMLRIEATGVWRIVLSVHDELVAERFSFEGSLEEFVDLMEELPQWAKGCPVKAEGWSGPRYRK